MRLGWSCTAVLLLLGGCAHIPDTSAYYFPAKTELDVKVTRLIACSPDNQVFSSQTVTTTTKDSADISRPIPINPGLLNSTFADTSFTAELHEDGRLKGINVSETGKAGGIVKSAASLAKLFLATGLDGGPSKFPKLCALIAAEKEQVVALEYGDVVDVGEDKSDWEIPVTGASQQFYAKAMGAGAELAPLQLTLFKTHVAVPKIANQPVNPAGISFKYPARVSLSLGSADTELWRDTVSVAQLGADGWLPIARAPAFGKATTAIDLNDNSSLKKVVYGSDTGAPAALDAVTEAAGVVPTNAERTAAAEEEVKRIKAERDLLKCRADPANC